MANVVTSDGVAGVSPDDTPAPYQNIQASPSAFGGAQAQAMGTLGKGLSTTGDFFGEVQTDYAINSAMEAVNGHLEKYKTLQGDEPLNKRADTEAEIDEAIKQRRAGLFSPKQQAQFDKTMGGYRAGYVNNAIGSHARASADALALDVNKASLTLALNGVANVADDDAQVEVFKHDARSALVKQAMLTRGVSAPASMLGGKLASGDANSGTVIQAALMDADRAVYKTRVQAVAVRDPRKALELADRHKAALGVDYDEISNGLRTRVTEQDGQFEAEKALTSTAQKLQNVPVQQKDMAAVHQAILLQESSNNPKSPPSVDGAIGVGQIVPDTFKLYAKPGEDINNPADNRAVSARIVQDLSAKYNGDPARIAVGYFSGPGNVAPVGAPQPWKADLIDGNGKSVSSYVQDITSRVGSQGPALAARASAYDDVLAATEGRPQVRQVALRELNQRWSASQIAAASDEKARAAARETSLGKYGDLIRAGGPGVTAMPWRQDENLTNDQKKDLDAMAMNPASRGPGPGYAAAHDDVMSGKIVNREQLLALTRNKSLTEYGYTELGKTVDEFNKPGAEADKVTTSNFYASAKRAVTLEDPDDPGSTSPARRAAWDKALPILNQAIAHGREKGMSNAELMNPDNKDSVWNVLKNTPGLMPTEAEKNKAHINGDAAAAAEAAKRDKPFVWQDIKTAADAQKAYKDRLINRDQAAILYDRNKWGKPREAVPQVPNGDAPAGPPDVKDLLAPAGSEGTDASKWEKRTDGTDKGNGYLGLLRRPDGQVSSEIAVGVEMDGKEVELPLMVPTLTRPEVDTLLGLGDPKADGFWPKVPQSIKDKAVAHARARIAAGKSPFAGADESPK